MTPAITAVALRNAGAAAAVRREPQEWIYKGLTLLLIGCPCALVISMRAATTSGLAAAARRGASIKAARRWSSWVVLPRWCSTKPVRHRRDPARYRDSSGNGY
ncbi:hypothetical protein ACNKHM_14290 [Shigella sonnei]